MFYRHLYEDANRDVSLESFEAFSGVQNIVCGSLIYSHSQNFL